MARKKKQELRIVGGTCLSVACDDNETYIVGTESGSLFKCKVAFPNVIFGQEAGSFEQFQGKTMRWTKPAIRVMNYISNKFYDKVTPVIE